MKKNLVILFLLFASVTSFSQVTESYKSVLKSTLKASGSEATFSVAIKQIFSLIKMQKTAVPDNVWTEFEVEFSKTSMDELVDMLAPVYYKHLTEGDLKKMLEFYNTPVGKKYAEKTPLITQESMQLGQQWGMQLGNKLIERLKEKGY